MPTLSIDRVSKQYEKHFWALRDISLRMESGVWGLVGPNGAGKTTLLRILASLLLPTEGVVCWNTQDIVRQPQVLRRELGFLPQDFGGYPQLTAREFLSYIGALKGVGGALLRRRVDMVLEMVNLSAEAKLRLRTFSGGMMRRLGIAQALLNDPELLIVDEPTAGLDPEERVRFRTLLAGLTASRIVLLSTHIVGDVEAVATRLVILREGRVLADTTPEELLARAAGTVWTVTVDPATAQRLQAAYRVSALVSRPSGVQLRIVSATRPHEAADVVEPSLEDAYLLATAAHGVPA
jgi:ABC-2 type transport system ATP-binding protein